MLSLDEEYIESLKSGLGRAVSYQTFPNLAYNDIQVSSIVYTREIIEILVSKFSDAGYSLTKITPPKSGQIWLRIKKIK